MSTAYVTLHIAAFAVFVMAGAVLPVDRAFYLSWISGASARAFFFLGAAFHFMLGIGFNGHELAVIVVEDVQVIALVLFSIYLLRDTYRTVHRLARFFIGLRAEHDRETAEKLERALRHVFRGT